MKEEIVFGAVALVFTSVLLFLRGLFLSRLRRGRGRYYEVGLYDDRGDSSDDDFKDTQSTKLSLASKKRLTVATTSDEWPSEIVVPAEQFCQK